jgi:phospholipase/lecithinase/hemolysin
MRRLISSQLGTVALTSMFVLAISGPAAAQLPFDELIVFGDSHSDVGNVNVLTGGVVAGPPYFEGRFSNGPIWVDRLAERLDLPALVPSLTNGNNYAFGGAEAGSGFTSNACLPIGGTRTCAPNIGQQIESFLADGGLPDETDLIVVQGGGNNNSAHFAAVQMAEHVATLAAAGGEYFLVPNLNRLSQDPSVRNTRHLDTFVAHFNAILDEELDELEESIDNITIFRVDFTGLNDAMISAPEDYGLTNVVDPVCPGCGFGIPEPGAGPIPGSDPDEYLFWDTVHFTTAANKIFGDAAADLVETAFSASQLATGAVPEPPSALLLLILAALATNATRSRMRFAKNS